MPPIVHAPTACGRHPVAATSDIVALQAASLVVVSVLCSMHEAVVVVVHVLDSATPQWRGKEKKCENRWICGRSGQTRTLPRKGYSKISEFSLFPFLSTQIFENEKNKAKTREETQGAGFRGPLWRRRDPPVLYHQHDAKGKAQVMIRFLYCTVSDFSPIKSAFTPGEAFWYQ